MGLIPHNYGWQQCSVGWDAIELAPVAMRGGATGDVFGNVGFAVEHSEACSTERHLGHFTDEGCWNIGIDKDEDIELID